MLRFEDILEIDDLGDEYVRAPHIYAPFSSGERGPFKGFIAKVKTIDEWSPRILNPSDNTADRIEYFPSDLRELDSGESK